LKALEKREKKEKEKKNFWKKLEKLRVKAQKVKIEQKAKNRVKSEREKERKKVGLENEWTID